MDLLTKTDRTLLKMCMVAEFVAICGMATTRYLDFRPEPSRLIAMQYWLGWIILIFLALISIALFRLIAVTKYRLFVKMPRLVIIKHTIKTDAEGKELHNMEEFQIIEAKREWRS